jgi:hypothetical protein
MLVAMPLVDCTANDGEKKARALNPFIKNGIISAERW